MKGKTMEDQELELFATLDIDNEWRAFDGYNQAAFLDSLRAKVCDPDEVDNVTFCDDCSDPFHRDNMTTVRNGDPVCETCIDEYSWCESCDEYASSDSITCINGDYYVCNSCLSNYYSFCNECDEYYADNDSYEHDHDEDDCDCEARFQDFSVRNDGDPALANDTRATVALPAGIISSEGIGTISRLLRNHGYTVADDADQATKWRQLAYKLDELGDQWQTKQGNYTKRLSRFAYKEFGLKVTPDMLSTIGCIARDHSTAVDFAIEVTRNLNLSAGEFGHEDSCYWQSYFESRCTLKSNGGFGLRTFGSNHAYGHESVNGRAWVLPVRFDADGHATPTLETMAPDAFVVFNGYGDLSGYAAARIVSHMAGMTYRKISFDASPMYVNSDAGYLVAPEEIASGYSDGSLSMSLDPHAYLPGPTS